MMQKNSGNPKLREPIETVRHPHELIEEEQGKFVERFRSLINRNQISIN